MLEILPHKALLITLIAALANPAQALIIGPYTADADTLQLWHFDEAAGFTGSLTNSVGTGFGSLSPVDINTSTLNANSALTGGTAYTGFGNAIDLSSAGSTSGLATASGTSKLNVPTSSVVGSGGAYTFEALVNVSSITTGKTQQIIAMDSNDTARAFQFRISGDGTLTFINVDSTVTSISLPIPTTGANAFVANEWFHVAVTYNGNPADTANMELFWTRMDESQTIANSLGTGQIGSDIPNRSVAFSVGNDTRDNGTEKLSGFVDEVRISGIVRGAGDMMFTIPEPSEYAMILGLASVGLLWIRRRRA